MPCKSRPKSRLWLRSTFRIHSRCTWPDRLRFCIFRHRMWCTPNHCDFGSTSNFYSKYYIPRQFHNKNGYIVLVHMSHSFRHICFAN